MYILTRGSNNKSAFAKVLSIGLAIALIVSIMMPLPASAAAVTVSLTSSAANVQRGATFNATLWADTSGSILDVKARVNYNPAQFNLKQVNYENSPLSVSGPESSSGTGYYTVHQFKQGAPYPSGRTLVAVLEFIALQDNGTATITISADEANTSVGNGDDGTSHTPLSVAGVSVQLEPAPAPSQPANAGTNIAAGNNVGGSSAPVVSSTPTDDSTAENAGVPVTEKAELAAAEAEASEVAEAMDIAVEEASIEDEVEKSLMSKLPVLIGLSLVAVIAGIVLFKRRATLFASNGVLGSDHETSYRAPSKRDSALPSAQESAIDTEAPE